MHDPSKWSPLKRAEVDLLYAKLTFNQCNGAGAVGDVLARAQARPTRYWLRRATSAAQV